jgi:Arm DNA-binding domain
MDRARRRNTAQRRLRVSEIAKLPPGWHEDGGGLRLVVKPDREDGKAGPRRWVLRVTIAGKRRNRGLGPYPLVTLDKAWEEATDIRRAARDGRDLIRDLQQQLARTVTFRQAFDATMNSGRKRSPTGSISSSGPRQWRRTCTRKSATCRWPTSRTPTSSPSWSRSGSRKPRPLGASCSAWSWCSSLIVLGQREKASPCVGIRQQLGIRHLDVEHLRALPYADVPAFLRTLRACNSEPVTKLAFEWLILTATRSGDDLVHAPVGQKQVTVRIDVAEVADAGEAAVHPLERLGTQVAGIRRRA